MASQKQLVRERFRDAVFKRAGYKCEGPGCNFKSTPAKAVAELDAHHITDRNEMPNGGYVKENGIALCPPCHISAEVFHSTGEALPGWHPDDLYARIKSSYDLATSASLRLKG